MQVSENRRQRSLMFLAVAVVSVIVFGAFLFHPNLLEARCVTGDAKIKKENIPCESTAKTWPKEYGPIVTMKKGKYKFNIPEKYFYYGLPKGGKPSNARPLGYAFWYPDLRPTYNRQSSSYNRRPSEPGRPAPSMDESIVSAGGIVPIVDPKEPYPPEAGLKKIIRNFGGENGRYRITNKKLYGLLIVKDINDRGDYYYLDDKKNQRRIRCVKWKPGIVNMNCDSRIYIKELNIKMGISFMYDQLHNWKEIEDAAISLLIRFMNAKSMTE